MQNVEEAKRSLVEKPLLATSVERMLILNEIKTKYDDLPQPLRFGNMLAELLDRVSVPLEPFDLIAGRCVDRVLSEEEEAIYQAYHNHKDHPRWNTFLNSGHCTYSWEYVAENGLRGLRAQALKTREAEASAEGRDFLDGIILIYDALERYLLRYANAADQLGNEPLARALRTAALSKPDSFRSALQLLWIITLVDCAYVAENPTLTVGRLDQILLPLYREDLAHGRLTREEARELITDYYCKHNLIMGRGEHQMGDETNSTTFHRINNFDAPQYLLLAGTDEEGKPAVNELTVLFAEAILPEFKNPVVVVRYFSGMDTQYPQLWRILTEKSLQSASLMYYNDDNMLKTYERIGIPPDDARGYGHFGCNWPTLGQNSSWMNGGPGLDKFQISERGWKIQRSGLRDEPSGPELLMQVLRECVGEKDFSIDLVYERLFRLLSEQIDAKLEYQSRVLSARRTRPAAVLSYDDCFYRTSVCTAGTNFANAKYHFQINAFQMFGTTVDSIIAVDKLVCIEKKLTLERLLQAVDGNFRDDPQILALCRNADKYGSDSQLSNAHARRLADGFSELVIRKSRPYLEEQGLFLTPCIQNDTWHLKKGEQFGATPDGRLAGTAFSQNIRPSNGAAINGLTAMLNSVACLPADGLLSGACNLDIDPNDFRGEDGHRRFSALLGVYFNKGGLHAQVTSADVCALRDAQKHPQEHRDLRVRVTGYSGVFVDICKKLQDDIIERLDT